VPQRRRKRRRIGRGENGIMRPRVIRRNGVWGLDFVSDRTADIQPLRMLVVIDDWAQECPTSSLPRDP
jgi:hypothetical protein